MVGREAVDPAVEDRQEGECQAASAAAVVALAVVELQEDGDEKPANIF